MRTAIAHFAHQRRLASALYARLQSVVGADRVCWWTDDGTVEPSDVLVVAADTCALQAFERWDQVARRWIARLFVVHADNGEAVIGPAVGPGLPGCLYCWRQRHLTGRPRAKEFIEFAACGNGPATPDPWLTPLVTSIVAIAAAERLIPLLSAQPTSDSSSPTASYWDLKSLTANERPYWWDATCPDCAGRATWNDRLRLESRPKPPGAVDRIGNVGAIAAAIARHAAGRGAFASVTTLGERYPNGPVGHTEMWLRDHVGPEICSGSGDTYAAARTISFLEAMERYAGARPLLRNRTMRSSVSMLGEMAVSPRAFGLYSDAQYGRHPELLTRYQDDLRMDFVPAHAFGSESMRLVPRVLAFYSTSTPETPTFVVEGSNGCSLGSCPEEAILHGIFEVVERDAFLLAWYARRQCPQFDPMRDADAHTRARCRALQASGFEVYGLDITSDIGIPSVWLLARARGERWPSSMSTAATHIRPEQAVRKAMRELTVMIDSYSWQLHDRGERLKASRLADDPSRVVAMRDHALSYASPEGASRLDWLLGSSQRTTLEEMRARYGDLTFPDLTDELRGAVSRVSSAGCEVFAVDQTRPEQADLRLCTYKVLISGTLPIAWGTDLQRHEGLPRLAATLGRSHRGDQRPVVNPAPHPFP